MFEPYIHIFPGNSYLSRHPDELTQNSGNERLFAIFGLEIPYLPEPLATESFVNQLDNDYQYRLQQQIRFLKSLYLQSSGNFGLKDYAVELRFVAKQSHTGNSMMRRIELFILGRTALNMPSTPKSKSFVQSQAITLYKHINHAFPLEYTIKPLDEDNLKRATLFLPEDFTSLKQTAEIRKFMEADIVYPFAWSDNSFAQVCKVLMQAEGTITLSVCIQPSRLEKPDQKLLLNSSIATAPFEVGGNIGSGSVKIKEDYFAEIQEKSRLLKARTAEYYLHRLRHPFLIRIQLVSDRDIPAGLLQVVGEEISSPDQNIKDTDLEFLPVGYGYQYCYPKNEQEQKIALSNFFHLEHKTWGDEQAEKNKPLWQLRYLVDATEANCAFRFPLVTPYGVPGIATTPFNPFSVQHQIKERLISNSNQLITLGQDGSGIDFELDVSTFSRHTLIVGSTGSGKTTTCQTILAQLWKQGYPFLVIEPVKSEYRRFCQPEFCNQDEQKKILFFTLGDIISPFEFNPFEILPGISVGTHISALKSCFTAAFPLEGPLSIILERAIREVYKVEGWDRLDHRVTGRENRRFPTLSDLCQILQDEKDNQGKVIKPGLITRLGYTRDIRENIEAALTLRLTNLRDSLLGQMLDVKRTGPWKWDELLNRPVILECDSVVDEDEKALIIALIFMTISFHRKVSYQYQLREKGYAHLTHLTLIEEAHRLFASTGQQTGTDVVSTKAKAITVFTDMLAEMRALGEGILIAEQIPTKLVSDIIKHPDLKIMHRITADEDRHVLGAAMNFSEQHRRFVTTLKQGTAAVYVEGLYTPLLVTVEPLKSGVQQPSEKELFKYMVIRRLVKMMGRSEKEVNIKVYLNQVAKKLCTFKNLPLGLPGGVSSEIKQVVKNLFEQALQQNPKWLKDYQGITTNLSSH